MARLPATTVVGGTGSPSVADHLAGPVEPEQQAPAGVGHGVVDDDDHDVDRTARTG